MANNKEEKATCAGYCLHAATLAGILLLLESCGI